MFWHWPLLLLLIGCSYIIDNIENSDVIYLKSNGKEANLNILFSHNINGETHPCGCRTHPLGGIAQVAGLLHQHKKNNPTLLIDTGDTFFPSTNIPSVVQASHLFKAQEIAKVMSKLGLNYYVPGERDFALGESIFVQLINDNKIPLLVSNLTPKLQIEHKKWDVIRYDQHYIFFIGIVSPQVFNTSERSLFTSPNIAIKKSLTEIEEKFPNIKNKTYILLSHSGQEVDETFAKEFPIFDWIIGAHSQSFLQQTVDIGKTKIAQVLSRNHYLGLIKISPNHDGPVSYELLQTTDETKDLWKDNPYITWLDQHKMAVEKVQEEEQKAMSQEFASHETRDRTFASCVSCHSEQANFWQSTSHSLAYITLKNQKAAFNNDCIGCHTLNFKNAKGFATAQEVVELDESSDQKLENYWKEFDQHFSQIKSVRNLKADERKAFSSKWVKLDEKFQVAHNFANVQCLHCHAQNSEHPFESTKNTQKTDFTSQCIQCHTRDQSPEWYKNDKGVASELNNQYFMQQLKKVSCPKLQE